MAHAYNPTYLGGWDKEDHSSRTAQANIFWDSNSKITRPKWSGDVAQVVGCLLASVKPWFKCQYHPHTHTKKLLVGGSMQTYKGDKVLFLWGLSSPTSYLSCCHKLLWKWFNKVFTEIYLVFFPLILTFKRTKVTCFVTMLISQTLLPVSVPKFVAFFILVPEREKSPA
jgi:hypothetical protein